MFFSPSELLVILGQYTYWIIFPVAVIEGPIIIVISGLLVNIGYLNGFVAYIVLVFADILGDSGYYFIGRYWRKAPWVMRIGKFVGYDEKSEALLEEHFRKHKVKTFMIGKITHGIGGTIQIAYGIARVNYMEFLWLSIMGTLPKVLALLLLGYYAGSYYKKINDYLQGIAFITLSLLLIIIAYKISNNIKKNFLNKNY